jgi:hypothetical protein
MAFETPDSMAVASTDENEGNANLSTAVLDMQIANTQAAPTDVQAAPDAAQHPAPEAEKLIPDPVGPVQTEFQGLIDAATGKPDKYAETMRKLDDLLSASDERWFAPLRELRANNGDVLLNDLDSAVGKIISTIGEKVPEEKRDDIRMAAVEITDPKLELTPTREAELKDYPDILQQAKDIRKLLEHPHLPIARHVMGIVTENMPESIELRQRYARFLTEVPGYTGDALNLIVAGKEMETFVDRWGVRK